MSITAENVVEIVSPPSIRGQNRVAKILEAATELFLNEGYDKTPVDAIVEVSGGSKATLYSYFPTKADLFRAVVDKIVSSSLQPPELDLRVSVRTALERFSERRLSIALSERNRLLQRLVIAEREQFPDIATLYYERGPKMGRDALAAYFAALPASDTVSIDDPHEAADFFVGMLMHQWCNPHQPRQTRIPTKRAIRQRVERVVDRFLKAYVPTDPLTRLGSCEALQSK